MTVTRTSSPIASSMTLPKMMLASGWATPWMISAASLTSNRPRSGPPAMLRRMPLAPSIDASSSGLVMAARAALTDRPSPVAEPMPMMAVPALLMIIFTSAKSVLIRPGTVIRLVIPCTPCISTSSAILKALTIDVFSLDTVSSRSLGMMMRVSTFSFRFWMPCSAWTDRRRPSKVNGRVTTPMVSAPEALGDLGHHRRGPGAGAAALAGGDEDHVGALERLFDLRPVLLGGQSTHLGVAAGAEAPGQLPSDVQLQIGIAHQQGLGIGVGGDEFDSPQSGLDHAVDGVDSATTHAHHFDDGEIIVLCRNGHVIPYPRPKVETVPTGELVTTIRSALYLVKHWRHAEDTSAADIGAGDGDQPVTVGDSGTVTSMVVAPWSEAWAMIGGHVLVLGLHIAVRPQQNGNPRVERQAHRAVGRHGHRHHLGGERRRQGPAHGQTERAGRGSSAAHRRGAEGSRRW